MEILNVASNVKTSSHISYLISHGCVPYELYVVVHRINRLSSGLNLQDLDLTFHCYQRLAFLAHAFRSITFDFGFPWRGKYTCNVTTRLVISEHINLLL